MKIEITPERKSYFEARGKIILNACPGSGKTTCVVHKLRILEEECKRKYGRYSGIACLSFTNTAKQEILKKYRQIHQHDFHYPHLVSTIDSFLNKHVTLPFFYLINNRYGRPKIVDEEDIINNLFRVRYQDEKGQWKDGYIYSILNFRDKKGNRLCHIYDPSDIWTGMNYKFSYKGKLPDINKVEPSVFQLYGQAILKHKIQKSIITSQDSAVFALNILRSNTQVGKWLIGRFPYFIIDEAQDNSEIQHLFFDTLVELGLNNIEMVGDPYQSLYEWRDAKPHFFLNKFVREDWNGLSLSHNRRSVQRIIDCFSIIREPQTESIVSVCNEDLELPITVYRYNADNYSFIIENFEQRCKINQLTDVQIVVRGNTMKNLLLGNLSEIKPWKTTYPIRLLKVLRNFEKKKIKDAVNELSLFVLELSNPDLDYKAIKDLQNERDKDYVYNGKLYEFLYTIPNISNSFEAWTSIVVSNLNQYFGIDAYDAFQFKQRINGYKMKDLLNQSVNEFFNKPNSKYNIPITTIHQVKGSTLDAILYFLDQSSRANSVSIDDFKQSASFPVEKQRIIYVACSRPKQLLAMAFPENITDNELKRKFGENIEIVPIKCS